MVFQKKKATPAKNFQANKKGKKQVEADDDDSDMFNDMDDSDDFEDDSEEEMPAQKTPKGRQSVGDKKVTFDMTKNTPGKTPNKNNLKKTPAKGQETLQEVTPGRTPNKNALKKTPTPAKGKGALQEFKGMKGGKPQQKRGEEEEDDEDDDDDDDDDEDEDLDLEMGDDDMDEDDDDDDDDDDMDEDDEEEDDDEEEEEENKPKQKQANKQKNNVAQNNQTSIKNEVTSPKKEKSPQKKSEAQNFEIQRRKERDTKTLYVGGLPLDATSEELQALSPDINNVILPKTNRKNPKFAYGFLVFASEAKAEANHKTLQSKKFRGQLLNIDFVGEKSQKKPAKPVEESKINERKLYVTGIPVDATIAQIAVLFPKAYQVTFNKSPNFRSASVNFDKIEDANEAFMNKNHELNGKKLIVVHSIISTMKKHKKNRPMKNKRSGKASQGGTPAKKMKFKQADSDDE